jgi:hypothetical protein
MQPIDYDDPEIEARWIGKQRIIVQNYLEREEIRLSNLEEKPIWFLAPYVALWKVNLKDGQMRNLWVISGDLPTDYCEPENAKIPRDVMLIFAKRWKSMSDEMLRGIFPKNIHMGKLEDQSKLGSMLKARSEILLEWSENDEFWQ